MVGEIRDPETAQIAIQSALTGHLVFTTVHANNVLDVLGRFLNMGVEPYQFVSALNCVLAQRLVRKICVHCKRPATVTRRAARGVGARSGARAQRPVLRRRRLHRVRRHRVQGPDGDLRAARPDRQHPRDDSRARGPTSEIKKAARDEGMRFLRESAVERVLNGHDDAARDQQGDVRRMSATPASVRSSRSAGFLASPPPSVASRSRATASPRVGLSRRGRDSVIAGYAVEPLAAGRRRRRRSTPPTSHDAAALAAAITDRARAGWRRGRARRAGAAGHGREGVAAPLREGAGARRRTSIS